MSGSFNVFEPPTLRDVKVGYISTDRGYISGVGLWDANVYAKKNQELLLFLVLERRRNILISMK